MNEREDITLTGDTAAWFNDVQDRIAEERDGRRPGNAETVRLLMQRSDL